MPRLVPSTEPAVPIDKLVPGTIYDVYSPFTSDGAFALRLTYVGPVTGSNNSVIAENVLTPSGNYVRQGNRRDVLTIFRGDTFHPYYPPEARQKAKELRAVDTAFEDPKSSLKGFPSGPDSIVASFLTGKKGSFQQQRHATEKAVGMQGPAPKHGGRRRKTRRRKNRK